jgi:hypothetical protein
MVRFGGQLVVWKTFGGKIFVTSAVGFKYKKQLLPIGSIWGKNLSSLSQPEVGQIGIFVSIL